jgi:hypothetical protein
MSTAIPRRLALHLSDLAFQALELPEAKRQPYACRRLLAEAAYGRRLCRHAARSVILIAADVLESDRAGTDLSWRHS